MTESSFVCVHVWVTEIQKFNTAAECYLIQYKSFSKFRVCLPESCFLLTIVQFSFYHCFAGMHPATQVRPQQVASSLRCRCRDKQTTLTFTPVAILGFYWYYFILYIVFCIFRFSYPLQAAFRQNAGTKAVIKSINITQRFSVWNHLLIHSSLRAI